MKNYGLPYMGSKSKILKKMCRHFPEAENFYDLFGGGFSVSHYMLENYSKKYKSFHYNEIKEPVARLVKEAIEGKYNYKVFKPEWISREKFFELKDKDAYVSCCWSFGNGQKTYLFSKEIELYKKSIHQAIVFGEFDDLAKKILGRDSFPEKTDIKFRRLFLRKKAEEFHNKKDERLERLQQLQQLQQLQISSLSYEKVEIKKNSIIYCDIPYDKTEDYGNNFDRRKFLDWASAQTEPVFISEYNINDDRFYKVVEYETASCFGGQKKETEKLYCNNAAQKILNAVKK